MNTLCIIHAYCTARMRNVPYMYACYNDGTITIGGIMTHHGLWAISHPHVQQIGRSPQFVAFLSPFFHRSCCLVAVALSPSLARSLAPSLCFSRCRYSFWLLLWCWTCACMCSAVIFDLVSSVLGVRSSGVSWPKQAFGGF